MKLDNIKIENFDSIIALLGLFFSLVLILYLNFKTERLVYSLIGAFSFVSFSIWLLLRNNASIDISSLYLSPIQKKLLLILVFILIQINLFSLYIRPDVYQRPIIYFILVALTAGIIFLEILILDEKEKLYGYFILFQTVLLGLLISWSQLIVFPSLLGVDPWYHQNFTSLILNSHFIPKNELYSKIPLFHTLISQIILITKLNYKYATMFSVSLIHTLCNVFFVFIITKRMFQKHLKVSYIAPLLLIISNHHIYMSFISIPNSFAIVFVLQILYFRSILKNKMPIKATFLAIFMAFILILSHTITALFMSIILFILWSGSFLSKYIYHIKSSWNGFNFFILFFVCMLTWWNFVSGHINSLASLIKWGFEADSIVNTPTDISFETLSYVSIYQQLFENIGIFLFFSMSFIGCLYMVSKKYSNSLNFSFAIAFVSPLFIGFFSLIFDKYTIVHRWWYYSQLMLSIPLAVSFLLILNKMNSNIKYLLSTTFFIFITFILIMNPVANFDNHLFSPNSSITFALTDSELQALKTSSSIWDNTIKTDWYYADSQKYEYNVEPFDAEFYNNDLLDLQGTYLLLIRNYINHNPFQLLSSIKILNYDLNNEVENLGFLNVYDNGFVNGYI